MNRKDGVFSMSAIASLSHDEETSRSIVEPEILLPVQLADPHTKQGEKRLMVAVLEEAVGTFQRNVHAKSRRGQRLFREAEKWIASPDTSWMFAFESICHTLGLDPHYLRGGLESLKGRRAASGARVYQFRRERAPHVGRANESSSRRGRRAEAHIVTMPAIEQS
jgi:hypothetical protein